MQNDELLKAYCSVNGITAEAATQPLHAKIMRSALEKVWSYDGLLPGETEELKKARLDLESPADGNFGELAEHFVQIDPTLKDQSKYAVIYIMYNRMLELDEAITSDSYINTNNNSTEKETKQMESNMSLSEMEAIAKGGQIGATAGSAPVGADEATLKAAREAIAKNKDQKILCSQNTVVEKAIFTQPAAVDRVVGGKEAMGTITDPAKNFGKFKEKTGCDDSGEEPVFNNIDPDQIANAKAIYAAFQAALNDPNYQVKPTLNEEVTAIKGFAVQKMGEAAATPMTSADVMSFIINDAWFVLNCVDNTVQLQVKKAKPKTNVATEGSGRAAKSSKKAKAGDFSGITTLTVVNKKNALETMCDFWKQLDKTRQELIKNYKSEMYVKYNRKADGADPKAAKKGTYRIPLTVNSYVTVVTNSEYAKVFGDGSSKIGRQATVISLTDDTAMKAMLEDIAEALGTAADAGTATGSLFDAIVDAANKTKEAEAQSQSAGFDNI